MAIAIDPLPKARYDKKINFIRNRTMLKSLRIKNYRCFSSFKLEKLGRINLLVGTNNSGKTSILELLNLYFNPSDISLIHSILKNRGESATISDIYLGGASRKTTEGQIFHLFPNHKLTLDKKITLSGFDENNQQDEYCISIKENNAPREKNNFSNLDCLVEWQFNGQEDSITIPLSSSQGLLVNEVVIKINLEQEKSQPYFVPAHALNSAKIRKLFDQISLTNDEIVVIDALKSIDPNIEKIASTTQDLQNYSNYIHDGFKVRLKNQESPIPIGSLGDGIWRILGITLSLVHARNNVLLIDEIDTGLHYSVMYDMWKLILGTAKKLDIQVFATTHNSDCWKSLAEVAEDEEFEEDEVTIHRIEKGATSSIMFDKEQMMIAAERDIEVR